MIQTLDNLEVKGKRVLVRSSLNVPMENGVIQDDFRLQESVSTIRFLVERDATVLVFGHLGRPDPQKKEKEFSLENIVPHFEKLLGEKIIFIEDPTSEDAVKQIKNMKPGQVAVLENTRFYEGEKANDPEFAQHLASLADLYINDAFANSHRAHASMVGVPALLPSAMGLLLQKEIEVLSKIRENPEKPMVVAVGGTKVETKSAFLRQLSKHAKAILLGNLISVEVKEKGLEVEKETELIFAEDGVDGSYDLGPDTIEKFVEQIQGAKTVFWAGPLGMVEKEKYEKGSLAIAQAIVDSGAYAVAGGGDLAAFLHKHGFRKKFGHVSTGGGAMLAFLAGEELPGIKALDK